MRHCVVDIVKDKKFVIEVIFSTVSVKIICGDSYEAQVLFDDLYDRLKSGESLTIKMKKEAK